MQQKQSILFIAKWYRPHIGGVEKHVEEITSIFKKKFTITIITEQFKKTLLLYEKRDGVIIYRIPIPKNVIIKKFYIWKWMLAHMGLFYRADVIHVHDVFYYILPFRLLFFYKKVYMTFHGYEGYPLKFRWIVARKIAETFTNGNICVGDFMKKWYFTNPISIIYGGVRLGRKNITPNPQTAVFFGRLDDQTGILEYLEAYKKICKIFPKFQLTVVGEGPLKAKLPKSIKIDKFSSNIEDYISKNRFIFVSRYLSMLEALAMKREVIAVYDNPIKKDYLQMSPFKKYISIAKNSDEIAEFVLNSLENEQENSNKIEKGSVWASNQTWEKIVDVYRKLWNLK